MTLSVYINEFGFHKVFPLSAEDFSLLSNKVNTEQQHNTASLREQYRV